MSLNRWMVKQSVAHSYHRPGVHNPRATQQEVSGGRVRETSYAAPHRSHYRVNHPLFPGPWKNCLPWNRSLVPKRLGTAAIDYYSARKRCQLLIHPTIWMNLQRFIKPVPKDNTLHDSIYITSLKWQNCRNREQISGCQGFNSLKGRKGVAIKRQHEVFSWWWKCSVSWLHPCQYPGCDTVLQFCMKLPSVETE